MKTFIEFLSEAKRSEKPLIIDKKWMDERVHPAAEKAVKDFHTKLKDKGFSYKGAQKFSDTEVRHYDRGSERISIDVAHGGASPGFRRGKTVNGLFHRPDENEHKTSMPVKTKINLGDKELPITHENHEDSIKKMHTYIDKL